MIMLLVTSGAVLALTCAAFILYQYQDYRAVARHTVQTLGEVIASNSTAAVAFDNASDETDVLAALHAEGRVSAAAVYDSGGALFAHYPANAPPTAFPPHPAGDGMRFGAGTLIYYLPIRQGGNARLGTLYLRWDLTSLHREIALYALIAAGMTLIAMLIAYILGRSLQQQISRPVQTLGRAALAVSEKRDYSVRAPKLGNDELGRPHGCVQSYVGSAHRRHHGAPGIRGEAAKTAFPPQSPAPDHAGGGRAAGPAQHLSGGDRASRRGRARRFRLHLSLRSARGRY